APTSAALARRSSDRDTPPTSHGGVAQVRAETGLQIRRPTDGRWRSDRAAETRVRIPQEFVTELARESRHGGEHLHERERAERIRPQPSLQNDRSRIHTGGDPMERDPDVLWMALEERPE